MRRVAVLAATGFGIGYLPVAPATWASAAAGLMLLGILPRAGLPAMIALAAVVALVAILVSGPAEKTLGHDARPIVADEMAGMFVSVLGVPSIGHVGPPFGITVALAFVLFRVFDILKPPPVAQAQRLPGGFGVVLDDLLAGLYANLAIRVIARAWPG